ARPAPRSRLPVPRRPGPGVRAGAGKRVARRGRVWRTRSVSDGVDSVSPTPSLTLRVRPELLLLQTPPGLHPVRQPGGPGGARPLAAGPLRVAAEADAVPPLLVDVHLDRHARLLAREVEPRRVLRHHGGVGARVEDERRRGVLGHLLLVGELLDQFRVRLLA